MRFSESSSEMWGNIKRRRKLVGSPLCFLFIIGLSLVTACPSDCVCKWKGGKQNVECVNRSLRTFPPTIDPGTQVLDVSGNSFETLPPDHFIRAGLINLQKVYLSKCRLSHINSRAFRGLSNLVDLDLSHNLLREIPSSAFPDCQGLMRLILSGNPIAHIQKRAFVALESLTSLELTHSNIDIIEHGAFEGLHSLEWIKLNGNRLKRIGGLGSLPLGLKGVWLEENPWDCDCHLLELRLWLQDRNVANSVEPRCVRPERLANNTLKELPIESFACVPQLSPTTMYQKIGEGRNVSLLCKVSSVPEASLEWLFNGQPLSNSSLNLVVETTNAYPIGSSANGYPVGSTLPHSSTSTVASIPIEKKSELIILNATSEENGTFLCVARNPAGVAMANFTVRVLTKFDADSAPDTIGAIPLFVSSYPNLFIIVLSTVAVIGFVIVLFIISLLICKCSRLCGFGRSRRSRRSSSSNSSNPLGGQRNGGKKSKNGAKRNNSSVVCGGKLDRHLSETSTLTTHTKSNGSVFLLSTSSELGDSNPDLIEGVNNKRVEGDGIETSFNFHNNSIYCSSSNVNGGVADPNNSHNNVPNHNHAHQHQQQYATLGRNPTGQTQTNPNVNNSGSSNNSNNAVILEPSQFNTIQYTSGQFNPFPMDYGLPKGLGGGGGTLVRRSPSYPSSGVTVSTSSLQSSNNLPPLPSNYDLAKYPKEYISPGQNQQSLSYGYPVPYHASEFYPTAYILPPGTYVTTYSGPGGEEYAVATMGAYIDPQGVSCQPVNCPVPPGVNGHCSCGPILEGNESDEGRKELQDEQDDPKKKGQNAPESSSLNPAVEKPPGVSEEGQVNSPGVSCSTTTNNNNNNSTSNNNNIARVQRQLTTQINESPDEGYEDEGAEGTEI